MSFLREIIKIFFVISLVAFVFSYFQKDNLPKKEYINENLYKEPVQRLINMPPFQGEKEDFSYQISPQYNYELNGLIVAYYNSESWLDFSHKEDPLNTEDICVIWGDNIKTGIYQDMKFKHGEFTCSWEFRKKLDSSQYSIFKSSQISNNHLISKDDQVYQVIKEANIGDQIYLKGYLVNYSIQSLKGIETIGARNTSVTRDDTGDEAYEIVYVTDFKILKKANLSYHSIYNLSKYSLLIFFLLLFISFFIPQKMVT